MNNEYKQNAAMNMLMMVFRQAEREAAQAARRDVRRDKRKLSAHCHEVAKKKCRDEYSIIINHALKFVEGRDDDQARLTRKICREILNHK